MRKKRWTGELVQRVFFRMSVLYPESPAKIRRETVKLLYRKVVVSVLCFLFLLLFDRSLYWLIISALLVSAVNMVYEAAAYARLNQKILVQFETFLNDLTFAYRYSGSIEEALSDTIMNTSKEMALHGNFIYELLTREDYAGTLEYYQSVCPDNYFLMFYAICYMVKSQGDKQTDKGSVFLDNVNRLIADINREINHGEKLSAAFSGLFGVSIIPLFALKPMELWAVSNVEGLETYYASAAGTAGTLIIAFLSIAVYIGMKKLKYPFAVYRGRSKLIELLTYGNSHTGTYGQWLSRFQNFFMERHYTRYRRLSELLRRTGCPLNVREFKVKQFVCGIMGIAVVIGVTTGFMLSVFVRLLFVAAGFIVGFAVPQLAIVLSAEALSANIQREVHRLQSVVQICIYQDGIDVRGLLMHMEIAANYYKSVIARASDMYEAIGTQALEELKNGEYNQSFLRLVDGLVACDVLPVAESFAGLERERSYDIEKRIIEEDHILQNKSAFAKFLAFLPMMAAIVLKLILPFVMEGMNSIVRFSSAFVL